MTRSRSAAVLFAIVSIAAASLGRAQTSEIAISVTDERGRPVTDAVVVAVPADGSLRTDARPRDAIVDQVDKEFVPRVTAVQVGTAIAFPNHDNVRHQVYSFSPTKRFELPLYAGVPSQPIVFDKPGIVVLGCNIHDWMVGYVYVSESPYFAKTGTNGKALIGELPPRAYVVRVWHPELATMEEPTRKTIDAQKPGRTEVVWQLPLKPERSVRRAPTADRGGRY